MVRQEGYSIDKAARSLGIDGGSIRRWIREFPETGAGDRALGASVDDLHRENARLREENRRLLMRLARASLFRARWTDEIHDEWVRNVAANRPDLSAESLARCRKLMNEHVPGSLVTSHELLDRLSFSSKHANQLIFISIHSWPTSKIMARR